MRRKINHSKRYKDYPKNVPRKLLKEFFYKYDLSVTKISFYHNVNTGVMSKLLNDGIEPTDNHIRNLLHLKPIKVCKTCGRKIVEKKPAKQKQPQPDYMKKWKHLSAEERNRAIFVYMSWRKKDETPNMDKSI